MTLVPLLWMLATSLKTPKDVFSGYMFWPTTFSLNGYIRVFTEVPFMQWVSNSTVISLFLTLGQLTLGVLAAYAFAHFKFRGRDTLFFLVLMTMMIPPQVTMVPMYMIVNELGWLNSFTGVIVPHVASGYAIFLLRQSFMTIPRDLGDAAAIDGCSALGALWHVYLRLSTAVISALGMILLVGNWNEYYWPLLVLTDKLKQTLPIAFVQFREEESLEFVPTMAVATLSIVPILFIYVIAQRNFVEGFANSGLKG